MPMLFFNVSQKAVTKQEEIEYNLSNRVRDAELSRKQREQSCKRLMNKLLEMRRTNAAKLKKEMVEMSQQEKALEQRVLREQSYLFKVTVSFFLPFLCCSFVNKMENHLCIYFRMGFKPVTLFSSSSSYDFFG